MIIINNNLSIYKLSIKPISFRALQSWRKNKFMLNLLSRRLISFLKPKINKILPRACSPQINPLKPRLFIKICLINNAISIFNKISLSFKFHNSLRLLLFLIFTLSRFSSKIIFILWFFHVILLFFFIIFYYHVKYFIHVDWFVIL